MRCLEFMKIVEILRLKCFLQAPFGKSCNIKMDNRGCGQNLGPSPHLNNHPYIYDNPVIIHVL